MKKHEKIYIKHLGACCLSFDDLSIIGDYDAGLNENKTVYERNGVLFARKTAKLPRFVEIKRIDWMKMQADNAHTSNSAYFR